MPLRVAVLVSGEGSNLQALVDARDAGGLDIELVGVFSDRPQAPALERALRAGVEVCALAPGGFANRDAHDTELFARVGAVQPQLIVCAGYMRIIGRSSVERFSGHMINLHPSLLPRHPGLHTHRRCIEAADARHGASVHLVTCELDGGPVIAQAGFDVAPGDDAETLQRRVRALEHPLLVATVATFAAGDLQWSPAHCELRFRSQPLTQPLHLDPATSRLDGGQLQ